MSDLIGAQGYMTPAKRQRILRRRARQAPGTRYMLTKGFTKTDALQFWNDARAIGLVAVGVSPRGGKLFGYPTRSAGQ